MDIKKLESLTQQIRKDIVRITAKAGSGHPTSSLSATDILAVLFEQYLRFDPKDPNNSGNDRLIFSKGHASPLFYSLYRRAGVITAADLEKYRTFDSPLEGHPTPRFAFTEAATGSLGQGLAVGIGEAIALKKEHVEAPPRVFVLLGDGELAEGSVWEAAAAASFYKLQNLIAIADINGLGQSQATMYGHDTNVFRRRFEAFGWATIVIDGHNFEEIDRAIEKAVTYTAGPSVIIANTVKGKGVSFIEGKNGWHGKPLLKDDLAKALAELGEGDDTVKFTENKPLSDSSEVTVSHTTHNSQPITYDKPVATRRAFGDALLALSEEDPKIMVVDGDTGNSTYTELVAQTLPDQFIEMYIAEQTMAGVALGLWKRGYHPVASTFAAFLTRAFDQIRMASVSKASILFNGSHAGVSIGQDGESQMGVEDIAMFRAVIDSTVVYPSDPYQTHALMKELMHKEGIRYIRTTREATSVLYKPTDEFHIGGSYTFEPTTHNPPLITVIAAGITLHEALEAQKILATENIAIRVIDCYSIKPIDTAAIAKAVKETKGIIVVEDHYPEGGIGEALPVKPLVHLAVRKTPRSATPQELLAYEEIDRNAIVNAVKGLL